jgi:hypothetical protein
MVRGIACLGSQPFGSDTFAFGGGNQPRLHLWNARPLDGCSLDTNILLRLLQPHHPHCPAAERALKILRNRNEVLNLTAQNLVESWAAITRPVGENGLGFTTEQASAEVAVLKRLFVLLPESPLLEEWARLVAKYRTLTMPGW